MAIHLQTPERLLIYVSDMERALTFYRDILGLPLKFHSPGWSEFNNGGTPLALHRQLNPQTSHQSTPAGHAAAGQATLVFVVDDLQATYEALQARGADFALAPQKQPTGLTFALLSDPDGFTITLQQRQA
ncbi:MAG TPA: VOC family protein [Ktedonobacteraceae bacterium]|jgi:lactoylglutathione lyase